MKNRNGQKQTKWMRDYIQNLAIQATQDAMNVSQTIVAEDDITVTLDGRVLMCKQHTTCDWE